MDFGEKPRIWAQDGTTRNGYIRSVIYFQLGVKPKALLSLVPSSTLPVVVTHTMLAVSTSGPTHIAHLS